MAAINNNISRDTIKKDKEEADDASVSSTVSISLPNIRELFADLQASSTKEAFMRIFEAGIQVFADFQKEDDKAQFIRDQGDYIIRKIGTDCDLHHEPGKKNCRHFFGPSGCNYEERNGSPCTFSHIRVCNNKMGCWGIRDFDHWKNNAIKLINSTNSYCNHMHANKGSNGQFLEPVYEKNEQGETRCVDEGEVQSKCTHMFGDKTACYSWLLHGKPCGYAHNMKICYLGRDCPKIHPAARRSLEKKEKFRSKRDTLGGSPWRQMIEASVMPPTPIVSDISGQIQIINGIPCLVVPIAYAPPSQQ